VKIISAGRFIVGLSWAKSLLWHDSAANGNKIIHGFSVCVVKMGEDSGLRIIIGPISLIVGYVR
jgi:hypothetical protein